MPNPLITDANIAAVPATPPSADTNGSANSSHSYTNGNGTKTAATNAPTTSSANGQGCYKQKADNLTPETAPSSQYLAPLLEKLRTRQARIGVLGMGYVGLPLITTFAQAGFSTLGFDTKTSTIEALQRGESHIGDIPSSVVQELRQANKFSATSDFSQLKTCDVAIICVPTPLTEMREPDLTAVCAACKAVRDNLQPGQLAILESTTYPGTTDEIMRPLLEATGLKAGQDFFLAFSPERIDPGNKAFPVNKVPKVVGGHTPGCQEVAVALYGAIVEKPVPVSSTQAAELTKLLENIFRSVNIALVNEMAMLCDRMEIDIWEVIDAAATKPYGFTKFLPGPGLGGHCIPIDPFYLSWKARQYNFQTNFIELAGEVNRAMPRYVVDKIMRALNDDSKSIRGSRIAVLGMSYKPDVGDARESPSICVAELLHSLGAEIIYNDPHVESIRLHEQTILSQPVEDIMQADCVALLTNHSAYDYEQIAASARLIVDTRNAFKAVTNPAARIIKL